MVYKSVTLCCLALLMVTSLCNGYDCKKTFGSNCHSCNETHCTVCSDGHCGSDCSKTCTGFCSFACHMSNCSCIQCADGHYGDNCSLNCSKRCYKEGTYRLCGRNGTCSEGCKKGFCSPNTACNITCSNCLDDDCYFDTCKCRKGCKPGLESCNETPTIPSPGCENCRNQICTGGVCIGCIDGYYGEQCEKKCICDVCYQSDGQCILCNQNGLIWCWTCAGTAVICFIASVVLLCWRKVREPGHLQGRFRQVA